VEVAAAPPVSVDFTAVLVADGAVREEHDRGARRRVALGQHVAPNPTEHSDVITRRLTAISDHSSRGGTLVRREPEGRLVGGIEGARVAGRTLRARHSALIHGRTRKARGVDGGTAGLKRVRGRRPAVRG
jgi:hypothetical protein